MKFTLTLMLMASALAALCLADHDWDRWTVREQETIQKTLSLSGAPMRLVVDNVNGYVHVTGTNGSQVKVTAHKVIRAETDSDLQQAKNEIKLDITDQPGSVSIYYNAPWRCNHGTGGCNDQQRRFYGVTYDIDVEVPRAARPVVSTVNHGDIRIEGTAGDFDIGNVNGGIMMTGISGSGEIHTVNGPVTVRFTKNPASATSFKSINGQLDLYFQPEFSADLRFKTFNGQIYSDFDVTPVAVPVGQGEQHDGKFVYRSHGLQGGRVGHGGAELSFGHTIAAFAFIAGCRNSSNE